MIDWEGEEWDLSRPNRQSLIGVLIYLARNFRAMAAGLFSLIALAAAKPKIWLYIAIGVIPLIVTVSLLAYLRYRNFTFHVSDSELIIHRGIFVKDRTVVPAERIQSIQITQNVLQRIIGLVSLKVDTAGSKGNELEIPALERARARHMQELLYRKKEEVLAEKQPNRVDAETSEAAGETSEEARDPSRPRSTPRRKSVGRTLVQLGLGDLLLVGLTENHLKTGFIALAVVVGYLSQYQEIVEKYLVGSVDEYARQVANAGLVLVLIGVVVYAVLSVVISIIRTFLRFFDLKAVLQSDALEISTGLLRRDESRVPIQKIQYIEWQTNPLRRLVGFESAKVRPSGAVAENSKERNIEIPALRQAQSQELARGVFPDYHLPDTRVDADPQGYMRLYTIVSFLFCIPASIPLYLMFGYGSVAIFLVAILLGALGYRYGRTVHVRIDERFLVVMRGWLFPTRIVVPTYKIQAVSLEQNVFLHRRGLCHMRIHTAGGDKLVRYLHRPQALELYDFILYKVERHRGPWM